MLLHAHTCRPLNQELQQVFIDKYIQGTPIIHTFKEVVGYYLTHEYSGPIIYQVVRSFSPMIPHDLSGLRATLDQPPCPAPIIPWSWISITATTHVLHAHLAAPSASSCCVICWVTHMPWTILRPSFRSCQVEPTTCTSRCALSNSHLRADCQCLRCLIRICVQDANVWTKNL